jgi:hypothetical protein
MPQLFSPRADLAFRLALVLAAGAVVGGAALAWSLARSDRAWGVGRPAAQPIPFDHALHAGTLDTDCRYCHATVEREAAAGMPTVELCLGCHERVWTGAAVLAPLRDSLALGTPIVWSSVHRLPEHARFHHAAHVTRGVACETCHGAVWTMARTVRVEPLSMGWCLDCHRDPGPELRPREAVFDRNWSAGDGQPDLARHYGIQLERLTDCTTCHR